MPKKEVEEKIKQQAVASTVLFSIHRWYNWQWLFVMLIMSVRRFSYKLPIETSYTSSPWKRLDFLSSNSVLALKNQHHITVRTHQIYKYLLDAKISNELFLFNSIPEFCFSFLLVYHPFLDNVNDILYLWNVAIPWFM